MGRLGRRVVLVEQSDQMYGGTCPNVGCVPTKALVHHSGNRRPDDSPQEWFEHAVGQVQALTSLFRGRQLRALNGADTITVVTGAASFVDPHTVGRRHRSRPDHGDRRDDPDQHRVGAGDRRHPRSARTSSRPSTNIDLIRHQRCPDGSR